MTLFLRRAALSAQMLDFAGGRGTVSVARQAALARFHELLRSGVVQAVCDPFLAAQLGYAVFPAQTSSTVRILSSAEKWRRMSFTTTCSAGLLGWPFYIGGSLNHNLKSVPLMVTADSGC